MSKPGHINHSLFWKNMAPPRSTNPERTAHNQGNIGGVLKDGPLKTAIDREFGSLEELKKQFNAIAAAIQGSGWAWLSLNPNGSLSIETTPNQDPHLSEYSTGTL
jgi:Fe-Mn family superoxide dismutase